MKKYTIQNFLEVKSSGGGSFSYDGSKICFTSNATGIPQIYLVPSVGGEPEQITSFKDSNSFAVFSPIKDEILFGKSEGGNEQTQFYLYSLETKEIKAITDNPRVKYNFGGWSRDGKYIGYSGNERNGTDFDVYIRDMESGAVECVYDKGGNCHASGFSPKNSYFGIRKFNSNLDVDIYLLSLKDKKLEKITSHEGTAYFGGMAWLSDELSFYTITNKDRDFLALSKYDVIQKRLTNILELKWDVENISISRNSELLSVMINEDGYSKLKLYRIPSMFEIKLVDLPKTGMVYGARFSKDSKFLIMNVGDARHTTDIWTYSIDEQKSRQITRSHQGVPADELINPELHRFKSFDGLKVPYFLFLPKEIEHNKKIPVIINIHGGPEGQYTPSFASLTQYFVYQGYAVVAPNVRGSSGYGKRYLALDDVEKRLDSVKDIASLHEHLKSIPQLDTNKVALMGGSYGGYMTLAGLAFYPDLWAAGVDTVGIVNLVTFLENTAPYRRALRESEYGSLEKDRALLESISPINSIQNIKAPLFVIHGANDPRVPVSEARQVVSKLKELGREVEFVVYEDEGHGIAKLKNRLDVYPRVVSFLDKILKNGK